MILRSIDTLEHLAKEGVASSSLVFRSILNKTIINKIIEDGSKLYAYFFVFICEVRTFIKSNVLDVELIAFNFSISLSFSSCHSLCFSCQ